ncbi:thioredoxin-like protein [Dactylonectria estremocensis]|uniref:Thioredoxin-like protein n=1 Tax=Dactylonectria estremocensis TaxID=1079267 RepID=A0A9P9F2M9_9HYPO|nr:thioredoxin-like protein [Dactylonectria estremocensis]
MASSSRLFRPISSIARSGAVAPRAFTSRPFSTTVPNLVVKNIQSAQEYNEVVKAATKPILIDCFATWCGPCKAISPILEKLSDDPALSGKIDFVKIDVDELPDVSGELGIRAMPTFIIIKDGVKADQLVGANPPALLEMLQKHAA